MSEIEGPKDTLRQCEEDTLLCTSFTSDLAGLDQAQLWVRDLTVDSHWAAEKHNTLPHHGHRPSFETKWGTVSVGDAEKNIRLGRTAMSCCWLIFIRALQTGAIEPILGWTCLSHQTWGREIHSSEHNDTIFTMRSGAKRILSTSSIICLR